MKLIRFLRGLFNGPRIERTVHEDGSVVIYGHNEPVDHELFARAVRKQFAKDPWVNILDVELWTEYGANHEHEGKNYPATFFMATSLEGVFVLGPRTAE